MLSWFQKKSSAPPKPQATNPGRGPTFKVAFSNGSRRWEENANLVSILTDALGSAEYTAEAKGHWVELSGGFQLQPQIVEVQPLEDGGVRTTTTLEVAHPLLFPGGTFEYQHASGTDVSESLLEGFTRWIEIDLPVFSDALKTTPTTCTQLAMTLPANERRGALQRRVVLGPPSHWADRSIDIADEAHPFCPCCLFTHSEEAFRSLIECEGTFAIRLFAMRAADGTLQADCRVNGADWPAGMDALIGYARQWPDRGTELRKQYVLVHSPA